jgi:hypothetical protein
MSVNSFPPVNIVLSLITIIIVFLWQNMPERRSRSSFSEGHKPEQRSRTFLFSCHQYNEVRRVLLSYCSSF